MKKYMETISKLASVNRYSDSRLVNNESVLEHSGFVSVMALFIYEELLLEGRKMDLGKLLSKAIMHDIDEVSTGDIAMPVKYHSKEMRRIINEMEVDAVNELSLYISGSHRLFEIWSSSKKGKEGSVVSLCDLLAVIYKISDEVAMRGNRTVIHILEKAEKSLGEKLVTIYSEFNIVESPFLERLRKECSEIIYDITRRAQ